MCDGVTQGRPGMELSLFSRDVIAMSVGVALTHDAFDAAMMLGVCDKIVPGLFIGALAFGTASVPRVDRIVGPGHAWVAEAKRQVAGEVGIDSPAGPSEILVIADAQASPEAIARELLAQAEHDVDACVVALCVGEALAARVIGALEASLASQPRRATIETALRTRGAVLSIASLDEAWPFAETFAAEHLQLNLADAESSLSKVRNAGTVFLGASTSVAFGDYLTGANHVLPTAGAGRRFSGLSVLDFVRWQTCNASLRPPQRRWPVTW